MVDRELFFTLTALAAKFANERSKSLDEETRKRSAALDALADAFPVALLLAVASAAATATSSAERKCSFNGHSRRR